MPRVGSSTIRMSAPAASHLPSTTFCWLPPLSVTTRALGAGRLDPQLAQSSASRQRRSRPRSMTPAAAEARSCGSDEVGRQLWPSTSPCRLRSSGTRPMPARMASAGEPQPRSAVRRAATRPDRRRRRPRSPAPAPVRPAPSSPATPRISPRCSVRLTSRSRGRASTRSTRSSSGAARAASARESVPTTSRSTIRRTSSRHWRRRAARGDVASVAQDGRAVADARKLLHPVRDVDDRDAAARSGARSRRTADRSRDSVSADVGSSMMRMRASSDSALATSTICCSATPSVRRGASGSIAMPSDVEQPSRASRVSRAPVDRRPARATARGRGRCSRRP